MDVRDEVARTILTSDGLTKQLAEEERKTAQLARSRAELVEQLAEQKAAHTDALNALLTKCSAGEAAMRQVPPPPPPPPNTSRLPSTLCFPFLLNLSSYLTLCLDRTVLPERYQWSTSADP